MAHFNWALLPTWASCWKENFRPVVSYMPRKWLQSLVGSTTHVIWLDSWKMFYVRLFSDLTGRQSMRPNSRANAADLKQLRLSSVLFCVLLTMRSVILSVAVKCYVDAASRLAYCTVLSYYYVYYRTIIFTSKYTTKYSFSRWSTIVTLL